MNASVSPYDLANEGEGRTDEFLREQRLLLELIASGGGLDECLSELCAAVGRLSPGTRAAVLLVDHEAKQFVRVVAPELPASFGTGVEGVPIDDSRIGTCAEAVFRARQVACEDIAANEVWSQAWRELCVANGIRACHSTPLLQPTGPAAGSFALCFDTARGATERELNLARFGADIASIALVRERSEQAVREREAWQAGQTEALRAALNGAPLASSLEILGRLVSEQLGQDTRTAFYLADATGKALQHVVGMGDDYAAVTNGFAIGPESLACGLAMHNGKPEITPDVRVDPLWQPWLWVAEKFDYRGCWSFPIASSSGKFVGSFAVYSRQPRAATGRDLHLASLLSETASIIISRHNEGLERLRVERQIEMELADTKLLHDISAAILHEDDAQTLYEKIVDAAVAIMHSDFASLQMLYPERGECGELRLLASRGYDADGRKFWEWVRADSCCTCGVAMKSQLRAMAPDVRTCDFLEGSEDLANAMRMGILAMQSTPLISRSGKLVGMISTHWRQPHVPSERDGRLFDILARQAADLIERKQAEKALRASEERLSAELERMSRLHALGGRLAQGDDVNLLLQQILAAAADFTGTDKGNIQLYYPESQTLRIVVHQGLGEPFLKHFAEDGWASGCGAAQRQMQRLLVEDVAAMGDDKGAEARDVLLADGVRAFQSTPLITRDGRLVGMLNNHFRQVQRPTDRDLRYLDLLARMAADLIERKGMEEALRTSVDETRRSRDVAEATLRTSPVPLLVLDKHLRVATGNEAFYKTFQVDAEATEGQLVYELGNGQWDIPRLRELLEKILPQHSLFNGFEVAHEFETIGHRTMVLNARRMEIGQGMTERIVLVIEDITERKRAEKALREAKEEAEAASRAKDHFLAQLSHELRTPLTPVLMAATVLRDDEGLPAEAREQLAMMQRNIALEARLIDDLLDLTRITRGKLALREERCDLHSLLGHVVEIVREEAREKQIHLDLDLKAEQFHLKGDPARLQQVFWNLLRNAVKFTPAGGHIRIASYDEVAGAGLNGNGTAGANGNGNGVHAAQAHGERDGGTFCVMVSDDGIGFEPGAAERLFEAFAQEEGHGYGGLGLGLAIARAIVDLHGGELRAKSAGRGRGAVFTVGLPGAVALSQEGGGSGTREPAAAEVLTEVPMRLLLVEDHAATLQVLSRLLRKRGHQVTTASTVADARAAALDSFDMVISDVGLPDGTGTELMAHLRDTYGLRGIALSGYGMDEDLRRSHEAGFAAHLIKPVEASELHRLLRTLGADDGARAAARGVVMSRA